MHRIQPGFFDLEDCLANLENWVIHCHGLIASLIGTLSGRCSS